MATVSETVSIAAPLGEVWDLYFDSRRWPAWVDQFAAIVTMDAAYPAAGTSLVWRSGGAGRGEVRERILEHDPQRRHRIEFSDPACRGELVSTFTPTDEGTSVNLEMSYELVSGGILSKVSDALFVRSQMKGSLGRTLVGLRAEAGGE